MLIKYLAKEFSFLKISFNKGNVSLVNQVKDQDYENQFTRTCSETWR